MPRVHSLRSGSGICCISGGIPMNDALQMLYEQGLQDVARRATAMPSIAQLLMYIMIRMQNEVRPAFHCINFLMAQGVGGIWALEQHREQACIAALYSGLLEGAVAALVERAVAAGPALRLSREQADQMDFLYASNYQMLWMRQCIMAHFGCTF